MAAKKQQLEKICLVEEYNGMKAPGETADGTVLLIRLPSLSMLRVDSKGEWPQEDEIGLGNMTPLSFYHGIYFPRHFAENHGAGIFLDQIPAQETAASGHKV
jgi:hypothetical protein